MGTDQVVDVGRSGFKASNIGKVGKGMSREFPGLDISSST